MADPIDEWHLKDLQGLIRESGIALLNKTTEIGLLQGIRDGLYGIHPALPCYFRNLFEQYYLASGGANFLARSAFAEAVARVSNTYHEYYNGGRAETLSILMAEEDNILAAWHLARNHGWWTAVVGAMQGLRTLYQETGRSGAWRPLVEAVVSDFVDPENGGPLPGREDEWTIISDYRVSLAREDRDWTEAERLQRVCIVHLCICA